MKILFLYNNSCAEELCQWLINQGHDVISCQAELDDKWCLEQKFDLTVSYTYRYIIKKSTIEALNNNVVNIHNSFLPWNRGASPNIWSIVDGTPRGVTMHYIDEKLDKGEIIVQRIVPIADNETLKSGYDKLDFEAKEMFKEAFQFYSFWSTMKKVAIGDGSYHSVKDGEFFKQVIYDYDMSVIAFKEALKKENV